MAKTRHKHLRKNKTKKNKRGKKWVTAFQSASKTFKKTGSLVSAKESLRKQALINARKLFGILKT